MIKPENILHEKKIKEITHSNVIEKSSEKTPQRIFLEKWSQIHGLEIPAGTLDIEKRSAIYQKGVEKLGNELGFDKIEKKLEDLENKEKNKEKLTGTDGENLKRLPALAGMIRKWQGRGYRTIVDALEIPKLKKELEEVRIEGNTEKIAKKEMEIVSIIQNTVGSYPQVDKDGMPFESKEDHPSWIVANQEFNCVGAAVLAGYYFKKLGIKNLYAEIHGHATNLVITSGGKVHLADMRWPDIRQEITGEDIEDGSTDDILKFADNDKTGLYLNFSKKFMSEKKSFWEMEGEKNPKNIFRIHKPESGGQIGIILNNLKTLHKQEGQTDAAIEAAHYALALDPENPETRFYLDKLAAEKMVNCIIKESGIVTVDNNYKEVSREGGDLVYRIPGRDCDYALKIFSGSAPPDKFFSNLEFSRLAGDNIAAPKIIKSGDKFGSLPSPWILWEWASGRPICEIKEKTERFEAARAAGQALRKMHEVKTTGFGSPDGKDGWSGNDAGWTCDRFLKDMRRLISKGGRAFSEAELEKIFSLTLQHDKLRAYDDPRLYHGDIAGDNIIYDKNTNAVTFIDPDEIIAGDPMFDLARSQSPRLSKEFREGVWQGYAGETPLTVEENDRFERWRLFRQALIACRAALKNDGETERYCEAAHEMLEKIDNK